MENKKNIKTTQKLFKNTYVFSSTVSSEKYSEKLLSFAHFLIATQVFNYVIKYSSEHDF